MKLKFLKCGCIFLVGSMWAHTVVSTCPHGNELCEMQTEPPHVPHEIPFDGQFILVNSVVASGGPNVNVDYVKLSGDIRSPKA
jgi:hypothetical protein